MIGALVAGETVGAGSYGGDGNNMVAGGDGSAEEVGDSTARIGELIAKSMQRVDIYRV